MIRIVATLFLLNGFIACNDRLEPLVVTTPKSVSTKIVDKVNDNELVILLNKNKEVGYRMDNESDSSVRILHNPTVGEIKTVISGAIEKVEKNGKKLILTIRHKGNQDYTVFKTTIDALKELEIYKFSMIADPDTAQAASK